MKKVLLTFSLILVSAVFAKAQSKLSYSLMVNESYSLDNYAQLCIGQGQGGFVILPPGAALPPTLPPVCIDKAWKTNITFNTNYEVSPRLRLQAGFGYNVMHLDKVNGVLGASRFKVEYLSIPVRAHYFFNRGKVRLYIGAGVRTDIRLNDPIPYTGLELIVDNSKSMAISLEALLGIEVPISSYIKVNFEPTYATALSSYNRDIGVRLYSPSDPSGWPYELIEKYPGRMGISVGLTFSFDKQ